MKRSKILENPAIRRLISIFLHVDDWKNIHMPINDDNNGIHSNQCVSDQTTSGGLLITPTTISSSNISNHRSSLLNELKNIIKFQI